MFIKSVFSVLLAASFAATASAQLTRIIQTGDPIPGSPGLTVGTGISSARMDHGQVALITGHTEFGVDKPSNTLLYWQDGALTKIADDFTPVPGMPGNELEFNTPATLANLSIDGSPNPAVDSPEVVFYASYDPAGGLADNFAIYRWSAVAGLRLFVTPGASLSHILPGRYANKKLLFSTWFTLGSESSRGLYLLNNGSLTKMLAPGDNIPGEKDETFDHLFDDYYFNGNRALGRLNATPIARSGWWDLRSGVTLLASPSLLIDDVFMTNDFHYWNNNIVAIDQSSNPNGSALALGRGTRGADNSVALLNQSSPGTIFQVTVQRGDPTYGAIGYQFWDFTGYSIRAGSIVFSASSYDANFEDQIHGIYNWGTGGTTKLIDTNETIDGKQPQSIGLLDRDPASGALLFSVLFTDNTMAVYSMPIGQVPISYQTWISDQFPDANGDENIVGALADPDNDRILNLAEFVLGGNANASDAGKTVPSPQAATGDFEFRRRTELPGSITVTPQIASNLAGPWLSGPTVLEEISTSPDPEDPELTIVRLRAVPPIGTSAAYFRISINSSE